MTPKPGLTRLGDVGADEGAMLANAICEIPPGPLAEIWKWVDIPPPGGRIFDKALKITLAASAIDSEIVAFKIPGSMIGLLRFFANQVGSTSDSQYVSYTLKVGDSPVTGFTNIIGPKAPGLTSPDALVVPLFSGNRVVVVASNSSTIAIQSVAARIKGWFWQPAVNR
jgi:hypothetical protein